MTYFLTNLNENSTMVFKAGALEIKPGQSKRVSEIDVKSGLFDDFISRDFAVLVESEVMPPPMYAEKKIVSASLDTREGISEDELKEFLAKKNGKVVDDNGTRVTQFGQG